MITQNSGLHRLTDYLRDQCDRLREIPGVHNIVVIQKDGYPIVSSGLWLSKEDIFNVSSITAAIQSAIKRVHRDIKYNMIETRGLNLIIFAAKDIDLNLIVTTNKNANLGGLFIAIDKFIKGNFEVLKKIEQLSNTPLIEYDKSKMDMIYRNFNVAEDEIFDIQNNLNASVFDSLNAVIIDKELGKRINEIVGTFITSIKQKIKISIVGENGFKLFSSDGLRVNFTDAFIYAIFETATKLLSNTFEEQVEQITVFHDNGFRLLYSLDSYVLDVEIYDLKVRLGLIRLLVNSLRRSILNELQRIRCLGHKDFEKAEEIKITGSEILEELKI